ncbi:MAG: hypothetical protein PHZ26_00730 [Candidatus Gracilibacteria bacterium]|nr:hypothetical protein [Candidatus Gracilibacteria bacterium]MDD2908261.1 hypothetical protein [Candidatus Gracilibacteria bacterium]
MENSSPSQSVIKQTAKNNIKSQFGILKSVCNLGIVAIEDQAIRDFIIKGISEIGAGAIVVGTDENYDIANITSVPKLNHNNLVGFDFFIYDNNHTGVDVVKYMTAGIVPIMPEKNTYSGILKDFNPMKFEGNGFFWKSNSMYCIFEKLISYLENIKFPEDKRILIKNVSSTF